MIMPVLSLVGHISRASETPLEALVASVRRTLVFRPV